MSKWRLRKWHIFYKEGGQMLVKQMRLMGSDPAAFNEFYNKFGDDQLEFVEKYITEKLKDDATEKLTRTQLAFLGYTALIDLGQQLRAETYVDEEHQRLLVVEAEEAQKKVAGN